MRNKGEKHVIGIVHIIVTTVFFNYINGTIARRY
jgi:hypothetical protein